MGSQRVVSLSRRLTDPKVIVTATYYPGQPLTQTVPRRHHLPISQPPTRNRIPEIASRVLATSESRRENSA